MVGGEGGIRTHVPVTRQDAFEASPLRPLRYLSERQMRVKRTFHYSPPEPRTPSPEPPAPSHQCLSPFLKKGSDEIAALVLEHARDDLKPVVEPRQIAAAHRGTERARLGLG